MPARWTKQGEFVSGYRYCLRCRLYRMAVIRNSMPVCYVCGEVTDPSHIKGIACEENKAFYQLQENEDTTVRQSLEEISDAYDKGFTRGKVDGR